MWVFNLVIDWKLRWFYIPYELSKKVFDWKLRWFYIKNHGNTIPTITPGPPIIRAEWLKKPLDTSQIPDLLELIAKLKQNRLTWEAVAFDWMKRRIQPLQARVTFDFEYRGKNDLSRCSEEEISNGEALRRVQRLFDKVEHVPHLLNIYSVLNPPKVVSIK